MLLPSILFPSPSRDASEQRISVAAIRLPNTGRRTQDGRGMCVRERGDEEGEEEVEIGRRTKASRRRVIERLEARIPCSPPIAPPHPASGARQTDRETEIKEMTFDFSPSSHSFSRSSYRCLWCARLGDLSFDQSWEARTRDLGRRRLETAKRRSFS